MKISNSKSKNTTRIEYSFYVCTVHCCANMSVYMTQPWFYNHPSLSSLSCNFKTFKTILNVQSSSAPKVLGITYPEGIVDIIKLVTWPKKAMVNTGNIKVMGLRKLPLCFYHEKRERNFHSDVKVWLSFCAIFTI